MKRIFIILLCLVPILYMGCSGEEHEQVKKSAPEESEYPMFDDDDEANKPLDSRLFYFVDAQGSEIATNTLQCPYTADESEYLTYAGTADEVTLSGSMPAWGKAELDLANKRLTSIALQTNPGGDPSSIVEFTLTASKGTGDERKSVDVKMYLARRPGPELPATLGEIQDVALGFEANSLQVVQLVSNKSVFSFHIDYINGSGWLNISFSGSSMTVKALGKNANSQSRAATVTVTAGINQNTALRQFTVTQEPQGERTYEVGDLYFEPANNEEGEEPVGVIWKKTGNELYLFSLKNITGLAWGSLKGTDQYAIGVSVQSSEEGKSNTQALINLHLNPTKVGEEYPAAAYCWITMNYEKSYTDVEKWYMPATSELSDLHKAIWNTTSNSMPAVDPSLFISGTVDTFIDAYYLSSTENNASQAKMRKLNTNAAGNYGKDGTTRPLRCLRKVTLTTP